MADLPEVPDLAVISLGRERVVDTARECARHGIKRLVVISQGFADADARGAELQAELVRLAQEHGVRILGPNTMGVLNPFSGFTTAFIDIPRDPEPGPLTMVAQSGAFQVGASSFIGRMGKAIDVGNACDLDMVDVLEYLADDPDTRIIVLHLEGIKRGRRFLNTAARVARTKPIIALKTGRSVAGAKAAMSHTGSLVGEDAIVDLALAAAGIIRVRTLVELLAVSRAFLNFRPMAGPRLGVATATGAFGIIAADACEDHGLELAPFPETLRELEEERIPWHRLRQSRGPLAPGHGHGLLYRGVQTGRRRSAGRRACGCRPGGGAVLHLTPPCRSGYPRRGPGTARRQPPSQAPGLAALRR